MLIQDDYPNPLPDDVKETLDNRLVLVTGAGGFLGQFVCSSLRSAGAELLTPDRQTLDLSNQAQIDAFFEANKPELVVHLAAECGGIGANIENPGRYLYANALMGLMLIEAARTHGVKKFVLISTTCAYPKNAPIPLQEDSIVDGPPAGATGPYGLAKRLLHDALIAYKKQYDFNGVVLVPANLYGPGDHFEPERSHVVPAMIRRYVDAHEKQESFVMNWGTGRPSREFLHARDAAEAITLALARHQSPNPVNLGTGIETPIAELAGQIAQHVGYSGDLRWDTSKPDGQPRRCLDTSRAAAFGFQARTTLGDGLKETIAWYKSFYHKTYC